MTHRRGLRWRFCCHVPIGIYCEPSAEGYTVTGVVAHPDGSALVRAELEHQHGRLAEELGQELAERLVAQGARAILEAMAL